MIVADASLAYNAQDAHQLFFLLGVAGLIAMLGWIGRTLKGLAGKVHQIDQALTGTTANPYMGQKDGIPGLGDRLSAAEAHDAALYEADAKQRFQIEAIAEQLLTSNGGSTLKAAVEETRGKVRNLEAGQEDISAWIDSYSVAADQNIKALNDQGITGIVQIPKLKRELEVSEEYNNYLAALVKNQLEQVKAQIAVHVRKATDAEEQPSESNTQSIQRILRGERE